MRLYGHDAQIAALEEAARAGRLHHAWLLVGPEGIGKALFAHEMARRLLSEAAGHDVSNLVAAGSHPDLRVLKREPDPKKKDGELLRNITIDQVRSLHRLFATTGSFSQRRIVIIDAVDDLERAGANALLKSLEEPPSDSLFLLVSHAAGRLLPTIRSRCRILRFAPLDDATMRRAVMEALGDADPAEIDALVRAGEGAPGRALAFAGLDIAALDAAIERLLREGDRSNALRSELARQLSARNAQPRYEAFLERAPARIAAHARTLGGGARLAHAIDRWEAARNLGSRAVQESLDPQSTVFALAGMLAALAPEAGSGKG